MKKYFQLNRSKLRWFFGLLVIVWGAFYCSNNWYQLILIQGNSMTPTYHNMQMAIIDKHNENYTYGNVIAFKCEALNDVLVKRIVACPGDSVVIKSGTLYVNGKISLAYQEKGMFEYAGIAEQELILQEAQYFVIGDNVSESKDSRYIEIGCVELGDILGCLV